MIPAASPAKRFFWISLLLPIEHDKSSRLAVSACACVRAFARSGASKFKESPKVPFPECLRSSLLPTCIYVARGLVLVFTEGPTKRFIAPPAPRGLKGDRVGGTHTQN